MKYEIEFIKQIHSGASGMSTKDVFVHRIFEVPFLPFPGLTVYDGDFSENAKYLSWSPNNPKRFRVWVNSDRELYDAELHRTEKRPIDDIVQEYLNVGWSISKEWS